MTITALSILALGAGLAVASPLAAHPGPGAGDTCPPRTVASVECPPPAPPADRAAPGADGTPVPADDAAPPVAEDLPAPPPAFFRREFRLEGDVAEVTGEGRRGSVLLQDAELLRAPRFADYLTDGAVSVQVTPRTRIVDQDGDRLDVEDLQPDDVVRVKGKFAPVVRWVVNEDGTTTPLLMAKRVVVLD